MSNNESATLKEACHRYSVLHIKVFATRKHVTGISCLTHQSVCNKEACHRYSVLHIKVFATRKHVTGIVSYTSKCLQQGSMSQV